MYKKLVSKLLKCGYRIVISKAYKDEFQDFRVVLETPAEHNDLVRYVAHRSSLRDIGEAFLKAYDRSAPKC